jgi:hypothetical protein
METNVYSKLAYYFYSFFILLLLYLGSAYIMATNYAVEDLLGKLEADLDLLRYPYALDRQG